MCRRLGAGHFFIKPAFVTVENKGLFGVFCLVGFCLMSLFRKLSIMHFVATGFVWRHFLMLNALKFCMLQEFIITASMVKLLCHI